MTDKGQSKIKEPTKGREHKSKEREKKRERARKRNFQKSIVDGDDIFYDRQE